MKQNLYRGIRRGTIVEIVAKTNKRVSFALATVPTSVKCSMSVEQFARLFNSYDPFNERGL